MHFVGIDVGSSFTKYVVRDDTGNIVCCEKEHTPVMQIDYFIDKVEQIRNIYDVANIVSCGYGRKNVSGVEFVNELTALAKGVGAVSPESECVLDIGGQDTKLIQCNDGKLESFFLNDKCAAGSGMFLINCCNMLNISLDDLEIINPESNIKLSTKCAVFAQSEIVKLVAENVNPQLIIEAVIAQILIQSKGLFGKLRTERVLLSGGLANIRGIEKLATNILQKDCYVCNYSNYLSAIGCSVIGAEK